MRTRVNEILTKLEREGFVIGEVKCSKHLHVSIERGGKSGKLIMSVSPKGSRAVKNVIAEARKIVR